MPRLLVSRLAAVVTVVALAQNAHGDVLNPIGRHLGVGWGDGYHSRTACPPKRHAIQQFHHLPAQPIVPPAKPIPWWKIPAEPEVVPAPQPNATTGTFPPGGPSLFRQPGEGSSVTVQSSDSTATR